MNEKNKSKYIMDSKNKQNAITLISLVITIVIMLILAGVAISIAVDPEGLFGHAENATEQWGGSITNEQIKIDEALSYLPGGSPSDLPAGWDSSKVADVVEDTENNRKAPIPVGYTASKVTTEDEISEGLVIYQTDDGQSPVEETANSDAHKTAMESRNQYVWIPVDDINDMVMCKKNGSTGTDGSTTTCNLVYDVSSNEITCQTHGYITSTELSDDSTSPNFIDTTGLAGRIYAVGTMAPVGGGVWATNIEFTQASKDGHRFMEKQGLNEPIIREPDLVTDYDETNYQLALKEITSEQSTPVQLTSANALKHQLNNKFIVMAKSVAKYGGFYISRFELSYENNQVISKKNKAVLTASSSAAGNYLAGDKWYGLYNKTLNNVEKGESVDSHMIWGCQYDQVIKFLGPQKGETSHPDKVKSTQEYTGYDRVENGNTVVDQDILNNIYDLEGNNYEWTALACNTDSRYYRGNYCDNANWGDNYPASMRR